MKKIFRKAVTVLGSTALIGATVAMAAAASYPEPFTSNTAIVVGANAAPSDNIAAASIASNLDANAVSGAVTTVSGGESFKLDKSSNHFNFNDAFGDVYSTLDSEDMDFLADGTYDDGTIDEDYEQTITVASQTLELFADNDYNDDEPTIGWKWSNTDSILTYVMEYDDTINFTEMEDTDLPLFGSEYYVLSAATDDSGTLELLDSAEKSVLTEGETVTVGDKTIFIEYISDTEVKFNVNGEITDKLEDHGSYELADETYIVANEILYSDKETGISKVEFSIGAGLMKLVSGEDIEINGEDIDGLTATFDSGASLTTITIAWASDDETFLTEENTITMPGFEKISLAFGGLDYADDSEMVSLENGETMTLSMDNFDLPLAFYNGTNGATSWLGEEDYRLVTAVATVSNYTTPSANLSANLTAGLDLVEDNRFIVTRLDDDLTEVETLYYEVKNIEYDGTDILLELTDLIGDNDLEFDALEEKDRGDLTVELIHVNNTRAYLNFTASSGSITFNKVVSDKGLVVTIPEKDGDDAWNISTAQTITFAEANEDEDVNGGESFTASVIYTSNDKMHVSTTNVSTEEVSSDNFIGYVPSDLASIVETDQSGDEYDFSIEYFGKEVTADVSVVADGSFTTATDAGVMTVMDDAVSTVSGKNLVVVGGSAINTVAADLLGGAYSEAMFTSITDVAAGEFLIQSFDRSGKTALLVAGYNAADTEKAVTYLLNNDVDTTVDMKMKGTSATSASLVTA